MNKKGTTAKKSNLKANNPILKSSNYDEIQYIDEWIDYMKDYSQSSSLLLSSEHDEESSFSSIMNFYLSGEEKYLLSSEDLKCDLSHREEKRELKMVNYEEESEDFESVDLCSKENLVDSNAMNNCSDELDKLSINSDDFDKLSICSENSDKLSICSENTNDLKIIKEESESQNTNCKQLTNLDKQNSIILEDVELINLNKYNEYTSPVRIEKNIKPFKVQITRIETPVMITKNKQSKPLLSQYFSEDSSSPNKTFGLISEAKNRTIQQNKRTESGVPLRKFVIETDQSVINIKDILKLNDLKNRTIIGQILKRSSKGYYTENWVSLRETFFTCYNSKPHKKSSSCVMNERNGDIEHPLDSSQFLTRKYSIDLLYSKLYVSKNRGKSSIFSCFSEAIPAEEDLVDITDVVVTNVKESTMGYTLTLKKEDRNAEINLNCLNFALKTNDGYRFFKVKNLTEYLTWNVAYRFRKNQVSLNIG